MFIETIENALTKRLVTVLGTDNNKYHVRYLSHPAAMSLSKDYGQKIKHGWYIFTTTPVYWRHNNDSVIFLSEYLPDAFDRVLVEAKFLRSDQR